MSYEKRDAGGKLTHIVQEMVDGGCCISPSRFDSTWIAILWWSEVSVHVAEPVWEGFVVQQAVAEVVLFVVVSLEVLEEMVLWMLNHQWGRE